MSKQLWRYIASLPNSTNFVARNAADSADVSLFQLDSSNNWQLQQTPYLQGNPTASLQVAPKQYVDQTLFEVFDDLDWTTLGSGTNSHSVVSVVAGGGVVTPETTVAANGYLGRISLGTGTTASAAGVATLDYFNSTNKIRLGTQQIVFETYVMIPVLSNATTGFTVEVGLADGNAKGAPTNGVYFSYIHSANSGAWVAQTINTSTSTPVNSAVTVVAGTWYKLRATINAAGTSVSFYINGNLIGTSTTNIPASTTGLRPVLQIGKSTNSATSSVLWADYVYWAFYR